MKGSKIVFRIPQREIFVESFQTYPSEEKIILEIEDLETQQGTLSPAAIAIENPFHVAVYIENVSEQEIKENFVKMEKDTYQDIFSGIFHGMWVLWDEERKDFVVGYDDSFLDSLYLFTKIIVGEKPEDYFFEGGAFQNA
ncbi:MAG: hypothetical protein KM296_00500 [Brockia lithotrophica]|nr:hypothetical protein [Brockia lithotrophica]